MAVTGWFVIESNVCKSLCKTCSSACTSHSLQHLWVHLIDTDHRPIALRTAFCCPDSAVFRLVEFCRKLKDEYLLFINVVLSSMIRALSRSYAFEPVGRCDVIPVSADYRAFSSSSIATMANFSRFSFFSMVDCL